MIELCTCFDKPVTLASERNEDKGPGLLICKHGNSRNGLETVADKAARGFILEHLFHTTGVQEHDDKLVESLRNALLKFYARGFQDSRKPVVGKCDCEIHNRTITELPTKAEIKGIVIGGVRHYRRDCGCNVIGATIIEFCPKDTFK